jgi:hypothetical protein
VSDFFYRPGCLRVSGEKGNDSTGAYDDQVEPDDAPKWPTKPILFPHGEQREDENNYSQECNQQKTYSSERKLGWQLRHGSGLYAVVESVIDARLVRLVRGLERG